MSEFETWLNKTLQDLNTDDSVFGPYIDGILTSEETRDEKQEALTDLLTGVTEDDKSLENLVAEILQKWSMTQDVVGDEAAAQTKGEIEDVDTKLAKLLEANIKTNKVQRIYTEEERELRSRILEDYGQVQVPDDEEEYDGTAAGAVGVKPDTDPDLVRNTNVQDVQALKKERREQSKLESQLKKEKDKEDRERQKKLREEKKEKRKTVKQERRR